MLPYAMGHTVNQSGTFQSDAYMQKRLQSFLRWMSPGLGIKRWLFLLLIGITLMSIGIAQAIVLIYREQTLPQFLDILMLRPVPALPRIALALVVGAALVGVGLVALNRILLDSLAAGKRQPVVDAIYSHHQRNRGLRVVAIGGGTGLPSVLRGLKHITNNLTAIVTVADNGGSSGRLRRDMGILPPGDLRNNIAALADDEDLMTQLFQYRFSAGDLDGHSFGNLFITALSDITGSMDQALLEASRVLAIQGQVLPATLDNITLCGEVRHPEDDTVRTIAGEAQISDVGGRIERVYLIPSASRAYPQSVRAILSADIVVIGPGSLFTSILPTLLITGILDALRASRAQKVYVCNVATQPGETDSFDVADHVLALEAHIGQKLFDIVVANDHFPTKNAGETTHYVYPAKREHPLHTRYQFVYADLTDAQYPWRHDPNKLARVLQELHQIPDTSTS